MKVLLTGAISWSDKQKKEIQNLGYDIEYIQDERIPLESQGISEKDIDIVVCNGLFLYSDIKKFKNLKYIQLTSAGYDRVPMEYIKKSGIKINNARGVYSIPMAEFAIAGVLQLYKKANFFYENKKKHLWKKNREVLELSGKSVCIIGCGSVGNECAKRFSAFDCIVYGIDINLKENEFYNKIYGIDKIDDVLSISDIVVSAIPLLENTRHLINNDRLNKLSSKSVFVNISRGGVVDEEALKLKIPEILGAVLDVYDTEPLDENNSLWEFENVILTPHNSFIGDHNRERLQNVIINFLQDKGM